MGVSTRKIRSAHGRAATRVAFLALCWAVPALVDAGAAPDVPPSTSAPQANSAQPGATFNECGDCPDMVVIPAGSFLMGSTEEERRREGVPPAFGDHEGPRHRVTIARPFALSRTEITRALFAKFAAETHLSESEGCVRYDSKTDSWPNQPGFSWRNPGFPQTDDEPASCIDWIDADAFAKWLAKKTGRPYRLASEAEWEYAARGGTDTARYWGEAAEPACTKAGIMSDATLEKLGHPPAWRGKLVCNTDRAFTQPVGSYPPNPFGLYDMLGSMWEWVADCFHDTYEGAPTDGSAWQEPNCQHRIPRGGGFTSSPWLARAATRGGPPPNYHEDAAGIRVARDLN